MGERIAELLAARGWSQAEFARRLGITRAAVSRWVGGEDPSLAMVRRIAEELGVPPSHLFTSAEVEAEPGGEPPPRSTMAAGG